MKDNPNEYKKDDLNGLPQVEVMFRYVRNDKGMEEVIPSFKLDSRLVIQLAPLSPVEVAKLLLTQNLDDLDRKKGLKTWLPIAMYKGIVKDSRRKSRIGRPYYSINIFVANRFILKEFLADDVVEYIQQRGNEELEAMFIDREKGISANEQRRETAQV